MVVFDIPKVVVLEGFTGIDGRVSWQTAIVGLGQINATHEEYFNWVSQFNFAPSNPTAAINMSNRIPVQQVEMVLEVLAAEEGEAKVPQNDVMVTVAWDNPTYVKSKATDVNGRVAFNYYPGSAGTYLVTFKLKWPTPLKEEFIYFPSEGGFESFGFTLDVPEVGQLPDEPIDFNDRERLAMAIIAAYAAMQTAKVVEAVVPG